MAATERITMTMRELDRFKVIQAIVEMGLKPGRAAERLGLTVRQVERRVSRLRQYGPSGVASGKRGRPDNHKLPVPARSNGRCRYSANARPKRNAWTLRRS
ncbi:helix-turn-helix domain-containing protein [Paraburkholderia saeva]|jgi:Homeodomain-like domain|uniref:Helix-turn-helix domain-containing protein n=1 Tax=Paraburkholderia saeva TaxID=2777537 RepID=A0A9N8S346_9BURK|nr:hypothetical protein R52603_05408 [Paraburkholderia saeva]CAG4927216.1 hypothetical protein R70241_05564 [Paraburkholderia saeva]CAG4927313.1 hypothetical protein LMG31841_05677 [Paraburkholderia saeva]